MANMRNIVKIVKKICKYCKKKISENYIKKKKLYSKGTFFLFTTLLNLQKYIAEFAVICRPG